MAETNQGRVIYPSELPNEEVFSEWVATAQGTDVRDAYFTKRDELLSQGREVIALSIIDDLNRQTRAVDVSKNRIRARFPY